MATEREIRQRLEPEYVQMFVAQGQWYHDAREAVNGLFEKAKEASRAKHLARIDATTLLNLAQTNDNIRWQLEWKFQQGVREEDLQWWWNMPDLERQVLLIIDDMNKYAPFAACRRSGLSPEEATRFVLLRQPRLCEFFNREDEDPSDIHCSLPVELKARIVQFIERLAVTDPDGLWTERAAHAGSFNALIREEIRLGNV